MERVGAPLVRRFGPEVEGWLAEVNYGGGLAGLGPQRRTPKEVTAVDAVRMASRPGDVPS